MVLVVEVNGIITTNCYIYADDETKHGFLIDPGAEAKKLLRILNERQIVIEKVLLTHGHFDHIGAVAELQDALNVEVCMQSNGCDYVKNPAWNLSDNFGLSITLNNIKYLEDNTDIVLSTNADFKLKIISAPGHTTDGAIYYSARDKVAFVGDTIFAGSYGRTDFAGGDETVLIDSIKHKVLTLPEDTFLLSGHSEPTTVKNEKMRPWYN